MWLKVDDSLISHPKLYAAGRHLGKNGRLRAFGIYLEGLSWTNRHLTDGFLPFNVVEAFSMDPRPGDVGRVLAFDDVRLWELTEKGYQIHDYHVINPTAEAVKAKRDWDAKRKQLYAIPGLVDSIRRRDRDRCRYCGVLVCWTDRKSSRGGTYDHIFPRGDNNLDNVVVCCYRCNSKKGGRTPAEAGMPLLSPGDGDGTPDPDGNGTSSKLDTHQIVDSQNLASHARGRARSPDPRSLVSSSRSSFRSQQIFDVRTSGGARWHFRRAA